MSWRSPKAVQYDALLVETHEDFDICGLTVDDKNQFANDTPIPAGAFKETWGVRLALDAIQVNSRIVLKVRNVEAVRVLGAKRAFRAKLQVRARS